MNCTTPESFTLSLVKHLDTLLGGDTNLLAAPEVSFLPKSPVVTGGGGGSRFSPASLKCFEIFDNLSNLLLPLPASAASEMPP